MSANMSEWYWWW